MQELKRVIKNYDNVSYSFKLLKEAFNHEKKLETIKREMDLEDRRIVMVHRNPQLASKQFPFKQRIGVKSYFQSMNSTGYNPNLDTNSDDSRESMKHKKIDEKFLRSKLSIQNISKYMSP